MFSDLELILGKAKFHGEIENDEPADANPSMRIALTGDALDVDGLAAFSSLFVSDTGGERFADRDLDIKLKAGPVSASGLTAESVDTALRPQAATWRSTGWRSAGWPARRQRHRQGQGFRRQPQGNIDASIVAVDLAPVIDQLAAQYPGNLALAELDKRAKAYGGLFEDAEINFVGTAARNDDGSNGIALSAKGKAGGTTSS